MKYELLRVFSAIILMEKENARKQTLEQLYERRKQVVRLHKQVIKIVEFHSNLTQGFHRNMTHPVVRAV
jgi:hypothetical protein